ncbi:MAG TPA: glyoxalase [Pseudomonas sp.]|uniref:VOC family protein n=1 Tax=Halopseudomonas pachastrellae TaxID=254161 RepID=UPI000C490821|nr:glyoxalase [Pseudomonas sp.]HCL42301.1 glyoxalase [Pseudomonas sp.]|tara:strand:- start:90 stop:476 length:387 start_codon:yes stop_codon:yes gene_type:complete
MSKLSYVNVFARDIEALSGFYQRVFDFPEVESIRSPIFVGLDAGTCCIGFNAPDAYELLHLAEHSDTAGCKFLLNIDVDSPDDVDRMVPVAVEAGATLIKPPYTTYYNWYQAVLMDPEGNVFRINHML